MELLNVRKFQEMSNAAFENGFDTLRQNHHPESHYLLSRDLSYRENWGPAVTKDKKSILLIVIRVHL